VVHVVGTLQLRTSAWALRLSLLHHSGREILVTQLLLRLSATSQKDGGLLRRACGFYLMYFSHLSKSAIRECLSQYSVLSCSKTKDKNLRFTIELSESLFRISNKAQPLPNSNLEVFRLMHRRC